MRKFNDMRQVAPNLFVGDILADHSDERCRLRVVATPLMHAVVVQRELALGHSDLVKAIYKGFCTAKNQMAE